MINKRDKTKDRMNQISIILSKLDVLESKISLRNQERIQLREERERRLLAAQKQALSVGNSISAYPYARPKRYFQNNGASIPIPSLARSLDEGSHRNNYRSDLGATDSSGTALPHVVGGSEVFKQLHGSTYPEIGTKKRPQVKKTYSHIRPGEGW